LAWMPSLGVDYHLGVDGLGLLMVTLTSLVLWMAVAASDERTPPAGYALLLFLQSGLYGAFTALDFVHWFLFWELCLIPAYFLVKLYGGANRSAAAMQFFVYTMVGSIALLIGYLGLYLATGTFNLTALAAAGAAEFRCGASGGRDGGPLEVAARWWGAGEPYEVPWAEGLEPVVAGRVGELPRFCEDFRGYGLNKVQHVRHAAAAGARLRVAAGAFCVAREHPPSGSRQLAARDPRGRLRTAALYERWKLELGRLGARTLDAVERARAEGAAEGLVAGLAGAPVDVEAGALSPDAVPPAAPPRAPATPEEEREEALRDRYILYNSEWKRELDRALSGRDCAPVAWVTHCSVERFPELAARVTAEWGGSASLGVHVPAPRGSAEARQLTAWLRDQYARLPPHHRVTASVVYGARYTEGGMRVLAALGMDSVSAPSRRAAWDDRYPANALLNAAIAAAESEAVVIAEPSHVPAQGLAASVLASLGYPGYSDPGAGAGAGAGAARPASPPAPGRATDDLRDAMARFERAFGADAGDDGEVRAGAACGAAGGGGCEALLVPAVPASGAGSVPRTKGSAVGMVRKALQAGRGDPLRWPFRGEALLARWGNRSRADFPARAGDLYAPVAVAGRRGCLPRFDERFRAGGGALASRLCTGQYMRHLAESGVEVRVCAHGFVADTVPADVRGAGEALGDTDEWTVPLAALYVRFVESLGQGRGTPAPALD